GADADQEVRGLGCRHSRASGNPASLGRTPLGPRDPALAKAGGGDDGACCTGAGGVQVALTLPLVLDASNVPFLCPKRHSRPKPISPRRKSASTSSPSTRTHTPPKAIRTPASWSATTP